MTSTPNHIRHSLLERGKSRCKTPRVNAKNFEKLIVRENREYVLTESNIRDLIKLLEEEMDVIAREQQERQENIEEELDDVGKRLSRIWTGHRDHRNQDGGRLWVYQGAPRAKGETGDRRGDERGHHLRRFFR